MKIAVTNLSPGKRQKLEKTNAWLAHLKADACAKDDECQQLSASLLEARQRRDRYDREAATNEDAATKLAAAEIQIRKLEPQLAELQKSLDRDLGVMFARRAGQVVFASSKHQRPMRWATCFAKSRNASASK